MNGWPADGELSIIISCNGVNYKCEREKLLGANLQKYLSVNEFGVQAAREKQHIIKNYERSNVRN